MDKISFLAALRSNIPEIKLSQEGQLLGGFSYVGGVVSTQGNNTKCKDDVGCDNNKDSNGNTKCESNFSCKNNSSCKNNTTCNNNPSDACQNNSKCENQQESPTDCNCGLIDLGGLL